MVMIEESQELRGKNMESKEYRKYEITEIQIYGNTS